MDHRMFSIDFVKSKTTPFLREAGVRRAFLFGSIARGEETSESDVDLLVEFPQGKTLLDLVRLKLDIEGALGKPVDIVTPRAISARLRPFIENDLVAIL